MKKKKLLIILILSLLGVLGLGLYSQSQSSKNVEVSKENQAEVPDEEINNFTQEAKVATEEEILLIAETDNYHLISFSDDQAFLISILGSPFNQRRLEAERAFLNQLNITENEACQLKVVITTPMFANPAESGVNYPLSFCP